MVEVVRADHHHGGVHALKDVSFLWDLGVTVLLGPNGAGKTTLCRGLAGDLRLDALDCRFGSDPAPNLARLVGYLPQEPRLIEAFTCHEYVSYCGWLRGLSRREAGSQATIGLRAVDLGDREGTRIRTLSGGMKRRVAIAGAFAGDPRALVLDEPMSGLDPLQRVEIREIISSLGERMPVLLATHVLQDMPDMADNVVMLAEGRVVRSGSYWQFADVEPGEEVSTTYLEGQYRRYLGARP